jgi:glycosyltransferase involved in cell wall biosynthesis
MEIRCISFIIPCFNEEETIDEIYTRLCAIADKLNNYDFEFFFINDGSTDRTKEKIGFLSKKDLRVKSIHFASNQGHQIALSAGMDFVAGDLIVTIDADLQDPPELLSDMLEKVEAGYDIVHAQRRTRQGETWFKLATANIFYWFINKISKHAFIKNCGDFRAFTRPVLEVARNFRERHKFLRGNFSNFGFRQCIIQYDRDQRFAGVTKYPFIKMVKFATDAVINFSTAPIKAVISASIVLLFASFIYLFYALVAHYYFNVTIKGWTSLIFALAFFGSLQLFCIAIVGLYVARIYEQGQNRPLYWIEDMDNIPAEALSKFGETREISISRKIIESKKKIYLMDKM